MSDTSHSLNLFHGDPVLCVCVGGCVSTLAHSHNQELPETLRLLCVHVCKGIMRGRREVKPFPASSLPAFPTLLSLCRKRRCKKGFDLPFSIIIPLRRRTHKSRRVSRSSWLWMRASVDTHPPTHTHTQHGITVEKIQENEICHSPLNYDLMLRFKGFGCFVASHIVSLLFKSLLRVRFLTHRLCNKHVGNEEVAKKMKHNTPPHTHSSSSSSSSPLTHYLCTKSIRRGKVETVGV